MAATYRTVVQVVPEPIDELAPTTYNLTGDDLARQAGTAGDLSRALNSLPGVGRAPFGVGFLALRGLSPRYSRA